MKMFLSRFVCLVIPFILFACSTTKVVRKPPTFRVSEATLAKGVSIIGTPTNPTTTFTTEDQEAVAYLRLGNLSGNHKLSWEWSAPDGRVYYTTGSSIDTGIDKFRKDVTAWHRLAIKGEKAATLPGRWFVRAFMDESVVLVKEFEIKETLAAILPVEEKLPPLREDAYAVIIGIDYEGRGGDIPLLKYPSQDAKKVYDLFTDPRYGGIPKENVILLQNETASRVNMLKALRKIKDWDGFVYVYYSGHGAPKIKEDKVIDAYLAPFEVDISSADALEDTGIRVSQLQEFVNSSKAKGVMVALDACYSGGGKSLTPKGAKPLVGMLATPEIMKAAGTGKVIMTSSAMNEPSWEDDAEIKGGIFTYYLLEGMKGKAGSEAWVKANEISKYLKEKVPRASRKLKGQEQTPQISGEDGFIVTRNWEMEQEIKRAEDKLRSAFAKGFIKFEQLNRAMSELQSKTRSKPLQSFLEGKIDEKAFGSSY